jgi:hypothetical protein
MKKTVKMLAIASVFALVGCGEEQSDESTEKELSFDEKVEKVCNCFQEKMEAGDAPKDCFMMQGELESTVAEDRHQEFLSKTNECAP